MESINLNYIYLQLVVTLSERVHTIEAKSFDQITRTVGVSRSI